MSPSHQMAQETGVGMSQRWKHFLRKTRDGEISVASNCKTVPNLTFPPLIILGNQRTRSMAKIVSPGLPAPTPALAVPHTQPNKLVSTSGPSSLPSHLTYLEENTRYVARPHQPSRTPFPACSLEHTGLQQLFQHHDTVPSQGFVFLPTALSA